MHAGAEDAQDGPASNEPWIHDLSWHGRIQFNAARRELWRLDLPVQDDALQVPAVNSSCRCAEHCSLCLRNDGIRCFGHTGEFCRERCRSRDAAWGGCGLLAGAQHADACGHPQCWPYGVRHCTACLD